jgi:hypothetical protein
MEAMKNSSNTAIGHYRNLDGPRIIAILFASSARTKARSAQRVGTR